MNICYFTVYQEKHIGFIGIWNKSIKKQACEDVRKEIVALEKLQMGISLQNKI